MFLGRLTIFVISAFGSSSMAAPGVVQHSAASAKARQASYDFFDAASFVLQKASKMSDVDPWSPSFILSTAFEYVLSRQDEAARRTDESRSVRETETAESSKAPQFTFWNWFGSSSNKSASSPATSSAVRHPAEVLPAERLRETLLKYLSILAHALQDEYTRRMLAETATSFATGVDLSNKMDVFVLNSDDTSSALISTAPPTTTFYPTSSSATFYPTTPSETFYPTASNDVEDATTTTTMTTPTPTQGTTPAEKKAIWSRWFFWGDDDAHEKTSESATAPPKQMNPGEAATISKKNISDTE